MIILYYHTNVSIYIIIQTFTNIQIFFKVYEIRLFMNIVNTKQLKKIKRNCDSKY